MPPKPATDFDAAQVAYDLVKKAAADLVAEYDQVCDDIAKVKNDLQRLPLAYLPFEDLKEGLVEIVDAIGTSYGDNQIRATVTNYAIGGARGGGGIIPGAELGKPLRYVDIEDVISGKNRALGLAPLLTSIRGEFDDRLMYFLVADLVKEKLRRVLDSVTPADFGYSKIRASDIGLPRAERRKAIADSESHLAALQARKAELENKLIDIGRPLPTAVKGQL